MRISSENKHLFEDLDLHDAELLDIKCDYRNKVVTVIAKLYLPEIQSQLIQLAFIDFSSFSISCEEPWGSGIYLLGATIVEIDGEGKDVDIEDSKIFIDVTLNSGDHIKIASSEIEWTLK
ncbi:hypothetical protein [Cohnella mopanensis]|uniref:hypothetical protein n=1 Tax=Cohnella mopanensis TaxID=2911966 RepID=UPI001EF76D1C|nr:hypothetical protein [Cohnella mopanensis]